MSYCDGTFLCSGGLFWLMPLAEQEKGKKTNVCTQSQTNLTLRFVWGAQPGYTNAQPITRSYFMKLIRKCFISHRLHLHPDIGHWEALQVIKEPPATKFKVSKYFPAAPFKVAFCCRGFILFFFSRSRRVKSGFWMHRPAPQNQYRSHFPHWNVFLHI